MKSRHRPRPRHESVTFGAFGRRDGSHRTGRSVGHGDAATARIGPRHFERPQDWLSEADGEVECFLSAELAVAFPQDGFQGEEGGIFRAGSLRCVVDPIHAAETCLASEAFIEVGWSRRRPNAHYLKVFERLLADGASLRRGGSGALGLVDVAIGRQDGYAELHINLWEVAAALVILREAGAKVSDFMAGSGPTEGNGIVACAPGLAGVWSDLPGLPRPI
jgi:myo-inositol-1(or 4)-monophosphatase